MYKNAFADGPVDNKTVLWYKVIVMCSIQFSKLMQIDSENHVRQFAK